MTFFKTKEERATLKADKGANLIANKQWDQAQKNLENALKKGNTDPEIQIQLALLHLRPSYKTLNGLETGMSELSQFKGQNAEFGVYHISVDRILTEIELRIREEKLGIKVKSEHAAESKQSVESIGKEYLELAKDYSTRLGEETLEIVEIFEEQSISPRDFYNKFSARGYEILSLAVKWDDPKKAAQYQQQAMSFNNDRNDRKSVERNEAFIKSASKTVHCWFCGKEVTGDDIHFVSMPSNVTMPIYKQSDADKPVPTNDSKNIYVCRACFSAIDNRDQLYLSNAKEYADEKIAQLEEELTQKLDDLQEQISKIISRLNSR